MLKAAWSSTANPYSGLANLVRLQGRRGPQGREVPLFYGSPVPRFTGVCMPSSSKWAGARSAWSASWDYRGTLMEEAPVHTSFFMQLRGGAILVYPGGRPIATGEDDEDDPS